MFPELVYTPSSNWNERPPIVDGQPLIDTVILHYTGMQSAEEALERLCDEAVEVSAHYLIEENGIAHQLVHPDKRAWHAGVSKWQGRDNLNHTSIGVELVNPGYEFGYRAFPVRQIDSLLALLKHLKQTYCIPESRFIGHSDIAPIRKQDPGELFPWKHLALNGYGIWPSVDAGSAEPIEDSDLGVEGTASLLEDLKIIGYDIENCNSITNASNVLKAFQRHWRPEKVTGVLDSGTLTAILAVANLTRQHQSVL
ncbi:N-acetylmuramoyl-L-alanine amidase [Kordiimonas aquimaris]|uniref:N-acetylmuramoyl-L-alanine amidase n=1 Tax=Kordiimonas aquimaris TaxID=707591 RepID=UPI0021D2DFC9|nr:N-acetylmuramoyl-L-alanine amidase [Kordiimonas aquimaris]